MQISVKRNLIKNFVKLEMTRRIIVPVSREQNAKLLNYFWAI